MRALIYSMGVSLDGYVAGPRGEGAWAAPDEELIDSTTSRHASSTCISSAGASTRR